MIEHDPEYERHLRYMTCDRCGEDTSWAVTVLEVEETIADPKVRQHLWCLACIKQVVSLRAD